MSATAILVATAVGSFLVVCIVAWYFVVALKQVRRTGQAVEDFFASTRPGVEESVEHLRSVLGRTDRMMAKVEENRGSAGGLVSAAGRIVGSWSSIIQAISMFAALSAGISQTWRSVFSSKKRGGTTDE